MLEILPSTKPFTAIAERESADQLQPVGSTRQSNLETGWYSFAEFDKLTDMRLHPLSGHVRYVLCNVLGRLPFTNLAAGILL